MKEVVIVSMARTPIGSFGGALSSFKAIDLGALVIKEAVKRAGIKPEQVGEVFMGNVLQANTGQAPARQAALKAGLSPATPCTAVNKVCASGMKAIMFGAQSIALGDQDIVVCGGMESMSNAPFMVEKARFGIKYGNQTFIDTIVRDGLQDPYNGDMMGTCGDHCATENGFSREDQDNYAIDSYKRAAEATEKGYFKDEIVPVEIPQRKGNPIVFDKDEDFTKVSFDKIPQLRPAFNKDGTVTAANASNINDGAAAIVLMSKEKATELGLKPLAKIVSYADAAQEPIDFTTSPALAIPKALKKAGLAVSDIDLFEINEAFAVVALANMKLLNITHNQTNIYGGGVSIGHPIGVSGCRIICTLISALKNNNKQKGAAGICNGGGGASAMIIELA
ncbi:MAG: acetyl-CoA C-acyltransferase [Bacteroidetes bacterium]|nr:acetyl-CoA C-acyltransferase [Bacteroidota bacterium]MCB9226379.1 acetyl-CoA C-acyltransferase [Chitinophagales bacterium]